MTAEPFALSGLDALTDAAVGHCADAVLVADDDGPSTAADLSRRTRRLARQFGLAGLARGERVLIVAGAQTAALVATIAALRAGLEPALAACGLGPVDLAAHARAADAAALIGPSRYGGLDLGDTYLSAAALADSIRVIATQGPEPVDGAADISFAALDALSDPPTADEPAVAETPVIATFAGPANAPVLVSHRQAALFADALSLVEQARINPSRRVVSLLPPASLAGLVGGPFAALLGASGLVLHGPFSARRFLAHCDADPGFHLLAPSAIGPLFADGALTADMNSLMLVSRFASNAFEVPAPVACDRPVIDLYAFAEDSVVAQRRDDGVARPPARVPDRRQADATADGLGARLNRARADLRRAEGAS